MLSFLSVNFQLVSEGYKSVLIVIETTCPTQIDGKEEGNIEEDGLKENFFEGVSDGKQVGRDEWIFDGSLVGKTNDDGGRDGAEDVSNFNVSDGT